MTNVISGTGSGPTDAGGFADHFSALADRYARYRPRYPAELFAWLATLPIGPRPGGRLQTRAWDCGTGSGQAAVALAGHFDVVVATDAAPAQLARATPHPRVAYRAALGEASGLPDGWADLVTVAQAVHWFDHGRFWPEVRRVLAPGGAVAVWTYDLARVDPAVDAVVEHYYREVVGAYWPPQRKLVEGGYRELRFPFAEVAPPALSMRAEWDLEHFHGFLGTWSAGRAWSEAHGGADPLAEIAGDLGAAWGAPARRRSVTWPLAIRAGR